MKYVKRSYDNNSRAICIMLARAHLNSSRTMALREKGNVQAIVAITRGPLKPVHNQLYTPKGSTITGDLIT